MQIHPEIHRGQLEEKQHLNVVDDLCRFILHEVVNVKGKYFLRRTRISNGHTLDYVRGAIKSIMLPLVAFLEDREKICIQCAL